VPCVYTGDEIGASYQPYEGLAPIVWKDTFGLRPWYKRLIELRTSRPSLHSPAWQLVPIKSGKQGLFAYVRSVEGGGQPLLVVLNFARDIFDAELELPASAAALASAARFDDLLGGKPVAHDGGSTLRLKLDALEAKLLEPA
jgi:glycosidase